jgi:hypothetical protein
MVCAREMCNSKEGASAVASTPANLVMIINCIHPPVPRTAECALDAVLELLFIEPITANRIALHIRLLLDSFRRLTRGARSWAIIADLVRSSRSNYFLATVCGFANGIVQKLRAFPSFRADWLLDTRKCGLVDAFRAAADWFLDLDAVRGVFPRSPINPFNIKSICDALLDATNPKFLLQSTFLGLADIALHTPSIYTPAFRCCQKPAPPAAACLRAGDRRPGRPRRHGLFERPGHGEAGHSGPDKAARPRSAQEGSPHSQP